MNQTILVADDDDEDFMLLKNHIQKCHQHVSLTYVSTGEEVLAHLQTLPLPNLIILDAKMPLMNGYETVTLIRASPNLQHIPILVWSGSLSNDDIVHFYQAGANSVILKHSMLKQIDIVCKYWVELVELPVMP
ncbi:response regulator [Spirosoma luteum]|uniref:response regulator n=1 Tax=Spirosoma luteum TaxID=431553 RepID=UPI000374EE65|nr:response regulator [Spirosoma luteum]